MKAPAWQQVWQKVLLWGLRKPGLRVRGAPLAFCPPPCHAAQRLSSAPPVHQPLPTGCQVRSVHSSVQPRVRRGTARTTVAVYMAVAAADSPRAPAVALAIRARLSPSPLPRATFQAAHRVLLCWRRPAMRARVRPLARRPAVLRAPTTWRCQTRQWTVQRFHCIQRSSSRVWQLPLRRRAVPYGMLSAPYRQGCREALQRAAKGYARVQHVYYPVPAHAVARIEMEERQGILYVYPRRRSSSSAAAACVWVVIGSRLVDGVAVRAIWRGE